MCLSSFQVDNGNCAFFVLCGDTLLGKDALNQYNMCLSTQTGLMDERREGAQAIKPSTCRCSGMYMRGGRRRYNLIN